MLEVFVKRKRWDSHMIVSTLSRGSLGGVGICSPHEVHVPARGEYLGRR
jgi:hypothetical protein